MQQSYTKNYLKIYLWQGVSLVLNFLSMFVVIPYLTSDPITYGIYSVCISFSIFLSYADLGFMGAGQKYAAEYFAKGDKVEEVKVIGFTNFILLIFLLLFSIVFFVLSQQPELLVKGIETANQEYVASSLILILAIFTPTTLLQRLLQMIFGIRMEDFIVQRANIIGSVFKILSVLWFFRAGKYDIVGYFLFTQIINFIAALITLLIARKRYNYNFRDLFRSIYFNKAVFEKTKGLAFASLFITISWILYYELDSIAIGKFLGANQVAIYAIGLTVITFFRSILGILFSPFNVRFNHFIGIGDETALKSFYIQIVTILAPVVVFPIISIAILAQPIILTWVGEEYIASVAIIQFLVFCNIFAFFTYPTNFMLVAKEKQKTLYLVNTLMPFVFWSGIAVSIGVWGVKSFAVFKLVTFVLSAIILYRLMISYLKLNLMNSLKKIFVPMLLPIFFLISVLFTIRDFLPKEKSKINLLIVAIAAGFFIVITFIIQYFSSENWRNQVKKILKLKINEN
ncbi:lipopolysaccharide biosynthesis protein [Flavobacterium sinopsychrotolerans]|uniref:Membrane protein involved in the export of O-antigen and teichoic acid n=2 Tax=Flavobacterium sinopsychrotolerans TaxID=604089 RepID=A0A1H8R925_9FLAO|nr:Membrane protein involved in the export of O-antigen and teichoic acid [Flavobacterium sinopsychrotolerans]